MGPFELTSRARHALLALSLSLAAGVIVSPVTASTARAKIWVDSTEPLVVVGSGFQHRERVVVTAGAGGAGARSVVRTSAAGRFFARFSGLAADGCHELTIVARGAAGERAAVKIVPECGTPLGP